MVLAVLVALACMSAPAVPEDGAILAYQVGAFLAKANAEGLSAILLANGFYGDIIQKVVSGKEFWTVRVLASPNPFEDLQRELLDAGFPSFPVR